MKTRLLPQALLVLVVGGAIGGVAFLLATADSPAEPFPPALPASVHAVKLVDHFGNGTHDVFGEIKAGTYRTGGSMTVDWPLCTWKFYRSGHLLAAGSSTGPIAIVVDPLVEQVESVNCKEWRRTA